MRPDAQAADSPQQALPTPSQDTTPQWRPLLHYTPRRNWMNDPNGPFFYKGVYHLFYQYNPLGEEWGNMSWGHATSPDLLHWHEHDVAVPFSDTKDIFSGTVVVDTHNTSGLGTTDNPPLVALYTSVFKENAPRPAGVQAQSLAYSLDDGRTWQPYGKDPVLTLSPDSLHFRDPSVFWYAPGGYWVMTAVVANEQMVKLYKSTNLTEWTFLSDFGPTGFVHPDMLWEMPSLFPLPLDGNPAQQKWILMLGINPWSIAGGSGSMYFVGSFDGTTFHAEGLPPDGSDPAAYDWLDYGADHYAALVFSGLPESAPITIGWMSNWDYAAQMPTSPWKGQMTLPMTMALRTIGGRPQLCLTPEKHYTTLVANDRPALSFDGLRLSSERHLLPDHARGQVLDIDMSMHIQDADRAGLFVRATADGQIGTCIVYDMKKHELIVDRSRSGLTDFSPKFSPEHAVSMPAPNGEISLHVIIDRNSVEVLSRNGSIVITDLIFPPVEADRIIAFSENGMTEFRHMKITRLDQKPE
ncbi:glycoside hydrolase family 32 protein [Komagataeibacter oboediens]|uniref:glycoside hydrolase family 32 protein n=1 Tax=Komagataeibacter oboediens TaxID=65958 RepID=UPI0023DAD824|nr:glycoside hydrolase family 32 protein [Komagataeibacter oboediens]WEQ51124.1 glycoside hydrolase family 32 protein [Komagataeibacter oboediens]